MSVLMVKRNFREERVGFKAKNIYGSTMKIIEYNASNDVIVEFEGGYTTHTNWARVLSGNVKNVYDRSVLGVGYLGEGPYKATSPQYQSWIGMFHRCYNEKTRNSNLTYATCTVSEHWHNFQNFALWYENNYYETGEGKMSLDKDILKKGNKIYSPETCVFVPEKINGLFVRGQALRGKFPIGVKQGNAGKFTATLRVNGHQQHLGSFDSVEEAFEVYKEKKEQRIKEVAEEYKGRIPEVLYTAMLNYRVEITD